MKVKASAVNGKIVVSVDGDGVIDVDEALKFSDRLVQLAGEIEEEHIQQGRVQVSVVPDPAPCQAGVFKA